MEAPEAVTLGGAVNKMLSVRNFGLPPRDADEMWALRRYYAALNGNPYPTFRDNVSVPSSRGRAPAYT
jgi:hypothetical protein